MPVSIQEGFAETARKGLRGEDPRWHVALVCCGMLDSEKSRRDHPVCMQPTSELAWEDLAEKTEWLRPYISDPVVENIVKQLDIALLKSKYRPAMHNPGSEEGK